MTFVPWHHVRKGTRLSPSLLFIVAVRGESLGTRLASSHKESSRITAQVILSYLCPGFNIPVNNHCLVGGNFNLWLHLWLHFDSLTLLVSWLRTP